jgi:hypothetical protein
VSTRNGNFGAALLPCLRHPGERERRLTTLHHTGAGEITYRAPIPTGNVSIDYTYHTVCIVIFYYTYIKLDSGASYTYIR